MSISFFLFSISFCPIPARVQFMVVLRPVKPHSTCSVERQISVMVKPNASLFIELPKSLPETAMDSMDTNIIHTELIHDNTRGAIRNDTYSNSNRVAS